MDQIRIYAYAKINLFLEVVSRLDNGYHDVNTVMQSISLADNVCLTKLSDGIELYCDSPSVPSDERNIAYRAARLFFEKAGICGGVKIEINKNIPTEAGLAGGSADAAATLIGLNSLYNEILGKDELLTLGGTLGADVPFCMTCGTVFADGKGDRLTELKAMPSCYVVVAKGEGGMSTPIAYGELDKKYCSFGEGKYMPASSELLINAIDNADVALLSKNMKNIFEDVVKPHCPDVIYLNSVLIQRGALGAMMSGSGTAVFGIFSDKDAAKSCVSLLKKEGYFAELTVPIEKRL